MSYPELMNEFLREVTTKHYAALAEAANDPHVKALLDLGYRFQTELVMPERIDEDGATVKLVGKLVPPPTDRPRFKTLLATAQVWVLAYRSERDEHDNGVLGVYATEGLARDAGIEEAKKDPNIAGRAVKWEGEQLFYMNKNDWYEVRPHHYVQEWAVMG